MNGDSILYEFVNDPGIRTEIRQARGYCNGHAWLIAEGLGNSLGIAIIQTWRSEGCSHGSTIPR